MTALTRTWDHAIPKTKSKKVATQLLSRKQLIVTWGLAISLMVSAFLLIDVKEQHRRELITYAKLQKATRDAWMQQQQLMGNHTKLASSERIQRLAMAQGFLFPHASDVQLLRVAR